MDNNNILKCLLNNSFKNKVWCLKLQNWMFLSKELIKSIINNFRIWANQILVQSNNKNQ